MAGSADHPLFPDDSLEKGCRGIEEALRGIKEASRRQAAGNSEKSWDYIFF